MKLQKISYLLAATSDTYCSDLKLIDFTQHLNLSTLPLLPWCLWRNSCVNLVDFIEIYIICLYKLPFPVILCWRLEEPTTTIDHTELERSNIVLPRDWSEEPNKPLETLLFCLFYICYTRSLLLVSPGSGYNYFLLTATQPQLCTLLIIFSDSSSPK